MIGAPAAGSNFAVDTAASGYTTPGVGVLGGLASRIYDAVPGFTTLSKVVALALIAMPIYVLASFLPLVALLDESAGATVDVIYYLTAPIAMSAAVYVYRRYAGGSSN